MATGQSNSSSSGCLGIGVIFVLAIILITVMIQAGADTGTSFLVGILASGCATGAYMTTRESKASKARAEAKAHEIAEIQAAAVQRLARLTAQYGEENAQKILAGNLWLGCTVDMLVEILRQPVASSLRKM